MRERRTSPVELLWDLVFVFAITQVTTLLSRQLTWAGFGRSMLVLALVWWAWSAFVWAANAEDEETPMLRLVLLAALVLIFIAGLSIPRAFGSEGSLFAGCYAGVRFLHLGLYADASRRGHASWRAIAGFALTVTLGMVLLIVGSLLDGWRRDALWAVAVLIDYAGPGLLTRGRLRGIQQVAVDHFAERYGMFIIICLGESVVTIGAAASRHALSASLVAGVTAGIVITIGLWWTYFVRSASAAEEQLGRHEDPVLAASDAYSYLHLLLVAGIIVFAVGAKLLSAHPTAPMASGARFALCGGVALYLAGHVASKRRLGGKLGAEELVAALAALVLYGASAKMSAWVVAAALAALLAALCASEALFVARDARAERLAAD